MNLQSMGGYYFSRIMTDLNGEARGKARGKAEVEERRMKMFMAFCGVLDDITIT